MGMDHDYRTRALDYVRHAMSVTGLTATALANKAGLAASTTNRPLRNPNHCGTLSLTAIGKIAKATGIDPAPFLSADSEGLQVSGGAISDHAALSVGQRIAARLDALGKNASAVALEAGLGRSAVRDIMVHDANPRIDTLKRLTGPLECDLSYLTGETTEDGPRTDTPGFDQGVLTDLLGFLHFLRAECGIDVPERHFETLRSLSTTDQKAQP